MRGGGGVSLISLLNVFFLFWYLLLCMVWVKYEGEGVTESFTN